MEAFYLHNPTYLELDDAYRSLPKLESVQVKSSNYGHLIHDLEKIGFVAIEIVSRAPEESYFIIRAFKGKHGPCHFTGKKVKYTGAALAAVDDDNHLLFSDELKEVCDKTFRIFGLPAYEGFVAGESDFQEAHQSGSSKDEDVPDDFESSLISLHDRLQNVRERSDHRNILFYPGPFRMLFLQDGSMVYRGKWCSVPADLCGELIEIDRCITSTDDKEGHISYFQDEYNKKGSACLLQDFTPEISTDPVYETDFSMLSTVGKELKNRLLSVIIHQRKYFILIGNDIEDQLGCCPSKEVTEANMLVKHGILSSLAEPLQGDSCPVTMYAFKNELSATEKGFSSNIDEGFRSDVHISLRGSTDSMWKKVLKWILLIFLVISLGIAVRKCQDLQNVAFDESPYEQLNPTSDHQSVVILFHSRKRCYQCLRMEKYTMEVLERVYNSELETKRLVFRQVVIDDPENGNLVNMFGIFAPTLVLVEFDQKELIRSKVLPEVTGLYREEMAFKDRLQDEIHQFLIEEDE